MRRRRQRFAAFAAQGVDAEVVVVVGVGDVVNEGIGV